MSSTRWLRNNAGIKLRGASFLMHQVYDDETTFKLVKAASNVSGLPVEVCLEEFGKHFLVYCQKNGYDQILRVLGSNLYDFLTNLDNLHDHLASIYPGMRAPSFRVSKQLEQSPVSATAAAAAAALSGEQQSGFGGNDKDTGEETQQQQQQQKNGASSSQSGSMYLHYYSDRNGLSPIVKGLVMAVAKEFFSTDIIVTECPVVRKGKHDHVVLKIDRRSQAQISLDKETSQAVEAAAAAAAAASAISEGLTLEASRPASREDGGENHDDDEATRIRRKAEGAERQSKQKAAMLSAAYGDLLSKNANDSLINSEIMMQAFPFHVIFDRQFNLVQVGKSLLRASSIFWRRSLARASQEEDHQHHQEAAKEEREKVKLTDLFSIVRPKIEFTFDAIAEHTNQVFVVRTKRHVLNADYLRKVSPQSSSLGEPSDLEAPSSMKQQPKQQQQQQARPAAAKCPFDRMALERRKQSLAAGSGHHQSMPSEQPLEPAASDSQQQPEQPEQQKQQQHGHEDPNERVMHVSLRLKGQMIMLTPGLQQSEGLLLGGGGGGGGPEYCLFLCSPRVDHLDQLHECGINMSDFALHDRARELMLMSHTHKEDREAVKKLDQASNDLKKMDTKLRQENKRTNEVLHNIFPAKIAALLSHGHKVESESHELVSCLYSDIIGFTKMCGSENVRPIDIVRLLNTLYLQFDNLTNIHGVFKVETIGDAYVIVGGLPEPVEDHADRCVRMGLDMVKVIATVRSPADNQPIQMRIGIHSGPVMAGIVGIRVPRYSLFGNTTTLANKLETHGVGGKIHISEFTLKNLVERERFVIEANQNKLEAVPFKTYFVTNFIGDEIETLKHEKILEEQLIRDFELMGNEVELVDDSMRSASVASGSLAAAAAAQTSQVNRQQLTPINSNQATSELARVASVRKKQPALEEARADRQSKLSEDKQEPRTRSKQLAQVLMDVEAGKRILPTDANMMQFAQASDNKKNSNHSADKSAKTNNDNDSDNNHRPQDDELASRLTANILAEALDQLVGIGPAAGGQTNAKHQNESTSFNQLLESLAGRQLGLNLRLAKELRPARQQTSGSGELIAPCPLCDGSGSLELQLEELQAAAASAPSDPCRRPAASGALDVERRAKLLAAAALSALAKSSSSSSILNRLLEQVSFSLSFAPPLSEFDNNDNCQEMGSARHQSEPKAGEPRLVVGAEDGDSLERLLGDLRDERRKLEQQVEKLSKLNHHIQSRARPPPPPPHLSQKSARSSFDDEKVVEEEEEEEEASDEFDCSSSARSFPAAATMEANNKDEHQQQQQQQQLTNNNNIKPARILSSNIQRMKRMDTLKRRKMNRQEQQQQQQLQQQQQHHHSESVSNSLESPRRSAGQLAESGSILFVHCGRQQQAAPFSSAPSSSPSHAAASNRQESAQDLRPQVPARPAALETRQDRDGALEPSNRRGLSQFQSSPGRQEAPSSSSTVAPTGEQKPEAAQQQQQRHPTKPANYLSYQTLKNSLASLIGDSAPGAGLGSRSEDNNLSALAATTSANATKTMPASSSKKFSLTTLGSSFTAALASPFQSPKRTPSLSQQQKPATTMVVDGSAEPKPPSMDAFRKQRQQLSRSRSRSSSSGGGGLGSSLNVAGQQQQQQHQSSRSPTSAASSGQASSAHRTASNCSCLKSSGSSQSIHSNSNANTK